MEVPGFLDPMAPLAVRAAAVDALSSELARAVAVCDNGARHCAGAYNRGVCEAGGRAGPEHRGASDPAFVSAPGDFVMMASETLHLLGGHDQVCQQENG